jgi:hypothetical protein
VRRGASFLIALTALACTFAPVARARSFKIHFYRVTHVTMKGISTVEGSTTDEYGVTTRGSATRTAVMDYRGRRNDNAEYIELPRHAFHGQINVNHLASLSVREEGSWTHSSPQGMRTTSCIASKRLSGEEPSSLIQRTGSSLHGVFNTPSSDVDDGDCEVRPYLDSPQLKWSVRESSFHRRTVTIPLRWDDRREGDISFTQSWRGTVTLRRLKVCRTLACLDGLR